MNERGYVTINGQPQWVSIRGRDRRNPVLLVLHGGPGAAFEPLAGKAWRAWEERFTVVHWDQPGAGRTHVRLGQSVGALTLERIVADGVAVAEHLRDRLPDAPIVPMGASWGSIVGLGMVRLRPDLFRVYVGAGQVVDMERNEAVGYAQLEQRLEMRGAVTALARLREIGPPPYPDLKALLAERKILMAHPPASERNLVARSVWRMVQSGYGPRLIAGWQAAQARSAQALLDTVLTYREPDAPRLPIPAVFIQGDEDIQTPTSLVADYVQRLQAPAKALVQIEGGGHNAALFMPDAFLAELQAATAEFTA